jgi:hypothetical protein
MTEAPPLNGQVLGQAERVTRALLDILLAETDTPFNEWVGLRLLATRGEMTADALVDQYVNGLLISRDKAAMAVANLRRAGHVAGEATIGLSPEGSDLYERIFNGANEIADRLYHDIPLTDLVIARQVLETVTERARSELALLNR